MEGMGKIVDQITPWLLELGSWIFGALIAFNLLILSAILTVGPVDRAVLIGTVAIAIGLPAEVAGFVVLRLAADLKNVGLEEVAATAFQEVGFTVERPEAVPPRAVAAEKHRARLVLGYSYGLLAAAFLLTFIAVTAILWHMAWWIGSVFIIAAVLSQVVMVRALALGESDRIWRAPGDEQPPPP